MEKSMFREYDIRGRVNDNELNIHTVENIAKAYGTYVKNKYNYDMAIIGYDSRKCSPSFRDAVKKGLEYVGISTVDIGMVTSPVFYFAQYMLGIKAGMMITGSHNPDGWSGFKMANNLSSTLLPEDIQEIYRIVINNEYKIGKGRTFVYDEIKENYINALRWRIRNKKRMKIVIDAGNGTAGLFAPALYRAVGFDVIELYCDIDPNFPNHFPNPSDIGSLSALQKATVDNNADIGIAFDGDGDRLGVIDDKGRIVPSDKILILLARQIINAKPKAKIVFDVKCTNALKEDIDAQGGIPIMWKTGHSYIKNKVQEEMADLGGEHSGHIFIVENYYAYDDALYAGLRLVEYLSNQDHKISSIVDTFKKYYSSPNIQVTCPDDKKYIVVEKILEDFKKEYNSNNIIDISGVRVNIKNGWGLIRASSNIPALVIMFEASTIDTYCEIKQIIKTKLSKFSEVGKEWENDVDPF